MSNKVNIIETRTIGELLQLKFSIPSYQRGYRWDFQQVLALLNDVNDYKVDNVNEDSFYCLQPVVVVENKLDKTELQLIDGQQRLTTILLILHYLNQTEFKVAKPVYKISFEVRKQQQEFLSIVEDEEKCSKDIDLFHLHNAYKTIENWFTNQSSKNTSIGGDFYSKLSNKVRVIWYQVNDDTDVIDIFTRLNIGKIPLTNAELIKALFLIKSNFNEQASLKQIQIASEWEAIEKKLQNNDFWYFIYSKKNSVSYDNRIEYIFDLIQEKKKNDEDYFTFNQFSEQFKNSKKLDIDEEWLKVKSYFQTLEEWFNDHERFHLIGFLIEYGANIKELRVKSGDLEKSEFVNHLKQIINQQLSSVDIRSLNYGGKNTEIIKKVLLLFNIETILKSHKATIRFPFSKYKEDKWDIEHVTSQANAKVNDIRAWCNDVFMLLTDVVINIETIDEDFEINTINKINALKSDEEKVLANKLFSFLKKEKLLDNEFSGLFEEVVKYYDEDNIKNKDSIGNLALLDQNTNRGYGNALFANKRNEIIKNDSSGIFVPIATKNLFLKYYSKQSNPLKWSENDAESYLLALENGLSQYLTIKKN